MTTDPADRPLPKDVAQALARIADGQGRKPTAAHPDCTCLANSEATFPEVPLAAGWWHHFTPPRPRPIHDGSPT